MVTLALAHRSVDLTALVPQLLRDDRFVVVFDHRPILRAFLNCLVVLVAHRGGTQLSELAEIDRIFQNTLNIDIALQGRPPLRSGKLTAKKAPSLKAQRERLRLVCAFWVSACYGKLHNSDNDLCGTKNQVRQ